MKLKALCDLQSPTPSGVGLSPAELADKVRSQMQADQWNREDAFRSRLLRADRKAAEREYFENRFFGPAAPEANEKRERQSNPPVYFTGLGGIGDD